MTDPIELRLQGALKSAALPGAPDSLREYLHQLPSYKAAERRAWRPGPLVLAATIAMLLVAALSAIYVGTLIDRPVPTPTASPSASVTNAPPTHSTAGLLGDLSGYELVVEESAGSPGTPISTDGSMAFVNLAQIELERPFIGALRCWGPGSARLLVVIPDQQPVPSDAPTGEPEPSLIGEAECNGETEMAPYLRSIPASVAEFGLEVPAGASWQVEVGEFLADIGVQPSSYGSLEGSDGWTVMHDFAHTELLIPGHGTGIAVQLPTGAEVMAVTLWCSGSATAAITTTVVDQAADVQCPSPDEGQRVEFEVAGKDIAEVSVNTDDPIWVRLMIEVDAFQPRAYPSPSPIAPDLASASYAEVRRVGLSSSYLARGRLGEPSSGYISVPGAITAFAAENHVLVGIGDANGAGRRLELWSMDSTEPLRVLAETAAPAMLGESWLDLVREQVFYSVWATPVGPMSIHRVGLDGTGSRELMELAAEPLRGGPAFAIDGSVLVMDVCGPALNDCTRRIIDSTTLRIEQHELPPMPEGCSLIGAVTNSAVLTCFGADGEASVVVESLDGSGRRETTLSSGVGGHLVETDDGPAVLLQQFDSVGATSWRALVLEEQREVALFDGAATDLSSVYRLNLHLPPNWLLFVSAELTDFPGFQTSGRQVPTLVNVLTGELIQLFHLPHDTQL
jgi:hypothetical protein